VAIAGFVVVTSGVGCIGTLADSKPVLALYALLTLAIVVALGAATECIFLYARDSTTGIGALDSAASSAAAELERS
jgi:hypothetical protein